MDVSLIQLVNRLQDTFNNLGGELDMPQIVVVGSQSAGKSSVLETIVGKDFLPRGSGIVTRRPLVLQLVHVDGNEEWAQFLHIEKKFTDFEEVKKEIEAETFRVAGQNKGISKLPISLKIFSPNVLDLTVVDLPGLTKIPVGDQPSDIERQIRSLVLDYISQPNAVILSVSGANVDLANSESLKLAKSVDPQMRRTLGVLTKMDLMDAGTNALDILTGRVYPLKLGFVGVVNRNQMDINENRPLSFSLQKEQDFFRTHQVYRNIAHKQGTKYLSRVLNQVLLGHIRDKLPDMKARLNTLMGQTRQELDRLGEGVGEAATQSALILRLMTQFARDFVSAIEGTSVGISTKELSGGARIYYIFNDVFGSALSSISPLQNLEDSDIRTAIRNSSGPRPSLFVPETAFSLLVKPQIKLLENPALRCVELVYEELVKICHGCGTESGELTRFPKLHAQLVEVVSELLRERLGPTSDYASSLIKIQASYINTNHPMFVSGGLFPAPPSEHESNHSGGGSWGGDNDPLSSTLPASDNEIEEASTTSSGDELTEPTRQHRRRNSQPGNVNSGNLRSVSNQLPERPASTIAGPISRGLNKGRSSDMGAGGGGVPGGPRETFLNYFFGANGPGPLDSSSPNGQHRSSPPSHPNANHSNHSSSQAHGQNQNTHNNKNSNQPRPTGRDLSGPSLSSSSGLLSGKRHLHEDGGVGFDMKSLGKHIEAVGEYGGREEMETGLIRGLISGYFCLVRQSIADLIPKAIMHFLVNHTSEIVQDRLVSSLYKPDLFGDLLNEDEGLVAERTRVKALLEAYKEAFGVLSEVGMKAV